VRRNAQSDGRWIACYLGIQVTALELIPIGPRTEPSMEIDPIRFSVFRPNGRSHFKVSFLSQYGKNFFLKSEYMTWEENRVAKSEKKVGMSMYRSCSLIISGIPPTLLAMKLIRFIMHSEIV
jgi:hypothetical protein